MQHRVTKSSARRPHAPAENVLMKQQAFTRVPSLDGLRAVSIALVLFGHAAGSTGFPDRLSGFQFHGAGAALGVKVFFVISGFIITTLLLKEVKSTNTISLPAFYLRRATRLLPALFVFLVATAIIQYGFLDLNLEWLHFFAGATFTVPFIPWGHGCWALGHLWSLAVEEHFYIIWPFALACFGVRAATRIGLALCMAIPLLRIAWQFTGMAILDYTFLGTGDVMIYGCFAAVLADRAPEQVRLFLAKSTVILRVVMALFVVLITRLTYTRLGPFVAPIANSFVGMAIAYLLLSYTQIRTGWSYRALNTRPMMTIGVLSYSLYLWQQPFLFPKADDVARWQTFPTNIVIAILCAVVSYLCVERPALNLKERYSARSRPDRNAVQLTPVGVQCAASDALPR